MPSTAATLVSVLSFFITKFGQYFALTYSQLIFISDDFEVIFAPPKDVLRKANEGEVAAKRQPLEVGSMRHGIEDGRPQIKANRHRQTS